MSDRYRTLPRLALIIVVLLALPLPAHSQDTPWWETIFNLMTPFRKIREEADPVQVRYRFTLTIQVEGELRSASVVQELQGIDNAVARDLGGGTRLYSRGEALVMTLPGRPTLMVPLKASTVNYSSLVPTICDLESADPIGFFEALRNFSSCQSDIPTVTTIRDRQVYAFTILALPEPDDPTTLVWADIGNLEAAFGEGVSFVGASVERTTEPLSRGFALSYPWVSPQGQFSKKLTRPGHSEDEFEIDYRYLVKEEFRRP